MKSNLWKRCLAVMLCIVIMMVNCNIANIHAESTDVKTFEEDGVVIRVKKQSEWEEGYIAEVTIANHRDSVVRNWKVVADMEGDVESVWNATMISREDATEFINAGWNCNIAKNSEVTYGMRVLGASFEDLNSMAVKKNKRAVKENGYGVEYKITNQYGKCADFEVTIHNTGEEDISNWYLQFNCNAEITNIWDAQIEKQDRPVYTIESEEYNCNIKTGESVTFGFQTKFDNIEDIVSPSESIVESYVDDEILDDDVIDEEELKIYTDIEDRDWNRRMINADSKLVEEEKEKADEIIRVALLDSGINYSDQVYVQERKNFVPGQDEYSALFEDVSGHGTSIAEVLAADPDAEPLCNLELESAEECTYEYEDDEEDALIEDVIEDTEEYIEDADEEDSDAISLTEFLDSGYENITGMNSNIELYSAKVLDENNETTVERVVEAIAWAEENEVDIISMSFGMEGNSKELHDAIKEAQSKGILLVAAAGNGEKVEYPAAYDEVMAVGSVDSMGKKSELSATGEEIEVVAPGEFILSRGYFDSMMVFSGTSMAVPHVVGLATILWQKDPSKSADFIRQLIDVTAKDCGDKEEYGYGLIDYEYALQCYDEYAKQYDKEKLEACSVEEAVEIVVEENLISENEDKVEKFGAIQKLYGNWGKDPHEGFVKKNLDVKSEKYKAIKDINKIFNTLKIGTTFVDNKDKQIDTDTETGVQGITGHPEFHGYSTTNYLASYMYLVKLANQQAELTEGTLKLDDISENKAIEECKELKKAYKAVNKAFSNPKKIGRQKWEEISSLCKTKKKDKKEVIPGRYRSLIIYGMALHNITDVYAHSSYCCDKSQENSKKFKWRRLNHTNTVKKNKNSKAVREADATFYYAKRYSNAKEVAKKVMSHITISKKSIVYTGNSLDDICGESYYNINAVNSKGNYKYFTWNKNILKTSYLDSAYAIKGMPKYIKQLEKLNNANYDAVNDKVSIFALSTVKDEVKNYKYFKFKLKNTKKVKNFKIKIFDGEAKKQATISSKKFTCNFVLKQDVNCIIQPYINNMETQQFYVYKNGKYITKKHNKIESRYPGDLCPCYKNIIESMTSSKQLLLQSNSLEESDDVAELCEIQEVDVDFGEWSASTLKGKIYVADKDMDLSNNAVVAGANITLKLTDSQEIIATAMTDSNGNYVIENLPAGMYKATYTKEGYIDTTQILTVMQNQTVTNNVSLELIANDYSGNGQAAGCVYDASTGHKVAGLTLYVREGIDCLTGDIVATVQTDNSGNYLLKDIPAGNYCVEIKDNRSVAEEEKYFDSSFNIKILGGTIIKNQNGVVTNEIVEDQMRIVLTWGATPSDLDSHLVGPTEVGSRFHIFYGNKNLNEDGTLKVALDLDDITSYGPETTTIYERESGDYYYYVYNYSRGSNLNLKNSGATVKVYYGNSTVPVYTCYVPQENGYYWNVFKIDGDTGELEIIDTVTDEPEYE